MDETATPSPIVRVRDLWKSYGTVAVLRGIDFEVPAQTMVAVRGRSGSGKSTLLAIIGTIETPDKGVIEVCGRDLRRLRGKALDRFRNREIAFIFQDHLLLPEFTALENILMPALIGGTTDATTRAFALELMEALGIRDRQHHFPAQLSGGEQQRVAVARALINRPRLILADEPTGNLDQANAEALHDLFVTFQQRYGVTFLIATHNERLARRCHHQWHLEAGRLVPSMPAA